MVEKVEKDVVTVDMLDQYISNLRLIMEKQRESAGQDVDLGDEEVVMMGEFILVLGDDDEV